MTGSTWYFHAIYIVLTNFALFICYKDDKKVISNLRIQGSKFGGKYDKFGKKSD